MADTDQEPELAQPAQDPAGADVPADAGTDAGAAATSDSAADAAADAFAPDPEHAADAGPGELPDFGAEAGAGGGAQISSDQAEGLRSMFGDPVARVFCLASALSADATSTLGLGTGYALRRAGHRTLVIDEVPLQMRHAVTSYPVPVRYDLGQVLSDSVSVKRAIVPVQDLLWYATGAKTRRVFEAKRARAPSLVQRLAQAKLDIDFVVIATTEPFGHSLSLYGPKIERLIVVGPDEESLKRGLPLVREISVISGGEAIPVLVVGGEHEGIGQDAFRQLQESSQALLEQPLLYMGWIRAASVSAFSDTEGSDPNGLVLPVTLYRTLAGTISGSFPEQAI